MAFLLEVALSVSTSLSSPPCTAMPKIQITTDGKTFDIEVPDDATDDQIQKKVIEFLEARKRFPSQPQSFPQLERPEDQ